MALWRIWTVGLTVFLALSGCKDKAEIVVSGTATYRERMALPGHAALEAQLVELLPGGKRGAVLARTRVDPVGTIPVAFSLSVRKHAIKSDRRYGVDAQIRVENRIWFESPAPEPVLMRGHRAHLALVLRRSPRPKSFTAYEAEARAIDKRADKLKRVEGIFRRGGTPGSYVAYVEKSGMPVLIKEGRELEGKGSTTLGFHFQGGALIRYTEDTIRRDQATGKEDVTTLKLYFDAGHYVGGIKTVNGARRAPAPTEIPEALVSADVAKTRVAAALAAQVPKPPVPMPKPNALKKKAI